ncbi:MAG: hypothetical protein ACKVJG_18320 [Candidatus Latescibacterota bacterium]
MPTLYYHVSDPNQASRHSTLSRPRTGAALLFITQSTCQRVFAIGSNEAVGNAVSRSREIANELHRRYAQEAVDLATALAASDETRHMLHSADLEHTPLATSAAAFGPYSL